MNKKTLTEAEIRSQFIRPALVDAGWRLHDVGTFTPSVNRGGKMKINFHSDSALKKELQTFDDYTGRVKNKGAAGLTNEELKALWDADHPDDPLEI